MTSASETAGLEHSRSAFSLWPRKVLGPPPGLKGLNLICWGLFVALLVVPLCVILRLQVKHGTGSVTQLHSDFVYVYGDGLIARNYPAARIYDYRLQQQVFNGIYPARNGFYGPSPYPPFVALFFSILARFSFGQAYVAWLAISLVLYLVGVLAACRAVFPHEPLRTSLVVCFSLAFFPFLIGTLLNGQLAAIATCVVGVAIYQEKRGNWFASGLMLALLSYKPTLLLLIVPMLVLTRRWRTLLGFAAGGVILAVVTTAFTGVQVWPAYADLVRSFGHVAGVNGTSHVQLWTHVDLKSSFDAIFAGQSLAASVVLNLIIAAVAICLALLLWKSANGAQPVQWLAWAVTLTWTLLVSVYVPIYDSVLAVIAIALTLGALREFGRGAAAQWITAFAVLIFALSWVTEGVAKTHGIQLLSIALFMLGAAQLAFLRQAIRRSSSQAALG